MIERNNNWKVDKTRFSHVGLGPFINLQFMFFVYNWFQANSQWLYVWENICHRNIYIYIYRYIKIYILCTQINLINLIYLYSSLKAHNLSLLDGIQESRNPTELLLESCTNRWWSQKPRTLPLYSSTPAQYFHQTQHLGEFTKEKMGKKTQLFHTTVFQYSIISWGNTLTHKNPSVNDCSRYIQKFSNHVVTTLICATSSALCKQHSPRSHYIIALMELQGTDSQISGNCGDGKTSVLPPNFNGRVQLSKDAMTLGRPILRYTHLYLLQNKCYIAHAISALYGSFTQ